MAMHYDNIRLEKGMYAEGPLGSVLERIDPSEQYKGTHLEGLDAYQRQLKRFDIKVRGPQSDVVGKFFSSFESAVLFPEFIVRSVRQGMEERNVLPSISATVTQIDGCDYRTLATKSEDNRNLTRVEERAMVPQTTLSMQENLLRLTKRGRMLVASYEAIRYQKIDLFSIALRQIGAQIMQSHLQDALEVVMSGDGNNNPAAVTTVSAASFDYQTLVEFWSLFAPYEMNTLLCGRDTLLKILSMPEFQNPLSGLNFQGTGKLENPMGATLLRVNAMPVGSLVGLDRQYALEMVQSGDVMVEYDKLIDRQLERASIVSVAGFAKIFPEASRVLKLT